MATFLGVPILIDGVAFGNLYLCEKRSGRVRRGRRGRRDHARRLGGRRDRERAHPRERRPSPRRTGAERRRAVGDDGHRAGPRRRDARRRDAGARRQARASARVGATRWRSAFEGGRRDPRGHSREPSRRAPWRAHLHREPRSPRRCVHARRPSRCTGTTCARLLHDHDTTPERALRARRPARVPRPRRSACSSRSTGSSTAPSSTSDDEQLLQAFSTTAAAALATARTAAAESSQHRLAAEEAERNRWARELHDETLQALAMLRMTLSAARRKGDADSAQRRSGGRSRAHRRADHEPARPDRGAAPDSARRHRARRPRSRRSPIAPRASAELSSLTSTWTTRPGATARRHLPGDRGHALPHRAGGDHQRDQALRCRHRCASVPATSTDWSSSASRTTGAGSTWCRDRAGTASSACGSGRSSLGGNIEVTSSPGEGTRVVVRLPSARRPAAAQRRRSVDGRALSPRSSSPCSRA